MDSKEPLTTSCETLSTTASEAEMNLQISTQTFKIEIKEETPAGCRDEKESTCSNYKYPSEPLESPEYVNYYDNKMFVLNKLKKELPEDDCPQSENSMDCNIVSENTELLTQNTEDKFSLNLKDANGNGNIQMTIKTESLEEQDINCDNSGPSTVHYNVPVTTQELKHNLSGRIFKNNLNLLKCNDEHIKIEINTPTDNEFNELDQSQHFEKHYDNYNKMLTHVTDVHSENNHKCEICGIRFNSVPNLKSHIKLLHELKNLPNQVLNNLPNQVFNNLPNQVTPNDMKCIYCNVDFKRKYSLNNHMKLCRIGKEDEESKYKCDSCERVYKNRKSLVKHIKKIHYDYGRMFECWCGKQFPSPIHLTIHKSLRHYTNKKNELYKCKFCEAVYNMKNSLTRHMKRTHYDYGSTFDCWCGKQFRTPQYLREHMRRQHGSEMKDKNNDKVQCDFCQKTFQTKHYLLTHIKSVHYDYGKVFECWCGKQFRTPILLSNHKRRHPNSNINDTNNDKLYRLNKHKKLCRTGKRDEEIKYKCDSCERVYKSKLSLTLHIKSTHYDYGRTFACWCGKQFRTPIHLTQHKSRQHGTNGKNDLYKCNYCEKVFHTKPAIAEHIKRMHYDYGKMFECWCGKQFRTPKYLREHMKRQHDGKKQN